MSVSESFVEARELAHEVVEAAHAGGKLAQCEEQQRRRRRRPQEQREMREIAALGEGADEVGHDMRVPHAVQRASGAPQMRDPGCLPLN